MIVLRELFILVILVIFIIIIITIIITIVIIVILFMFATSPFPEKGFFLFWQITGEGALTGTPVGNPYSVTKNKR
jgi:hypothetical protein